MNEISFGIANIDICSWESLVATSRYSSPFQTLAHFEALNETENMDAEVIVLSDSTGLKALILIAIIKEQGFKGFFSRRGIIFGGPLLGDITSFELGELLLNVNRLMRGRAIYLESRNAFDYSDYRAAFIKAGWDYNPYLNYQLSFHNKELEDIIKSFKYNRRREIRLSIDSGVAYRECQHENEIEEVYKILKTLYSEKVKLPLPDVEYFLRLFRKKIMKAFIVIHNGKIIGGSFCPFIKGRIISTYYYCGLREYNKKIFPTHLAILAVIEYSIGNDISVLDLMGAGKPGEEYGVRKYKSEFGGDLVEHGRFIKILNPVLYSLGKMGLRYLSKFSK